MKHALVGETMRNLGPFITSMSTFYYTICSNPYHQDVSVRCKWSGRVDSIRVVTSESDIHGYRFDGQLILSENNNLTYGLYMYLRHNQTPISGRIGAEDEETLFWHWTTEDTYGRSGSDDRDCFTACIQSVKAMDAQERARQRR